MNVMPLVPKLFLSSIGFIYVIAFSSYWIQFPGLVSSSGIEPVGRTLPILFPFVYDRIQSFIGTDTRAIWIATDIMCESIAWIGVLLSICIASGLAHHGVIFLSLTFLYYVLVALGGTFYSFQWDSLLLETSFIVGICYAPWSSTRKSSMESIGSWPVRFLLFKLMFMSGVVKILADCPTWRKLTALEYHFATQCLPGPLAWFAHQLHPFFLRLSVALTFLIEIYGAFLLILPYSPMRRIGAWIQITLQVMIILTGNYNFFNLLTISLCLPCIDRDEFDDDASVSSANPKKPKRTLEPSLMLIIFAYLFSTMFYIYKDSDGYNCISMKWSVSDCERLLYIGVPFAIYATFAGMTFTAKGILTHPITEHRRVKILVHFMVCTVCIGTASVPFFHISGDTMNNNPWMYIARPFIPPWEKLQVFHFSNGYGLFRRMTGVGEHSNYDRNAFGWAGLEPSIVKRPEIILEAQISQDNITRELKFRWKPGDTSIQPRQVAPHQPRLDWQMWFAALGSYEHNPWLVHLVYKLLQSCQPVVHLLDEPLLLNQTQSLSNLKLNLYTYDFTRMSTEWNKRIPLTYIIQSKSDKNWWVRSFQRTYLPPLDVHNELLKKYLASYKYLDVCTNPYERCDLLTVHPYLNRLCHFLDTLRFYLSNRR